MGSSVADPELYVFGWASRIRICIHSSEEWIRIRLRNLLSSKKKVRKIFIPTVLRLLHYFLSLKNDVYVPSKRINLEKKSFLLAS